MVGHLVLVQAIGVRVPVPELRIHIDGKKLRRVNSTPGFACPPQPLRGVGGVQAIGVRVPVPELRA